MISRQQIEATYTDLAGDRLPRISLSQRAVLKWATIEEQDQVLDMDCGSGALLGRLLSTYRLRACGLCPGAEQARATRDLLEDADVVYAKPDDIPFRSASFDVVFVTGHVGRNCRADALGEITRVLRAGGQLVVACPWFAALHNILAQDTEPEMNKRELMRRLQQAGFQNVSWRAAGSVGVVIAWKRDALS